MKINIYIIYLLVIFNITTIQTEYAKFELNTFKNISNADKEYNNFFYEAFNNILYSEIYIGPMNSRHIMIFKTQSIGLTIYNYNCDVPPSHDIKIPLLPNFSNSEIIDHIDDNETDIFGEYFIYILNNTMNINIDQKDKKIYVDFLFSERNDSKYIKSKDLRPYSCFNLGFHLPYEKIDQDEYALNILFQLKQKKLIKSYDWFIEYDNKNNLKAKLILGIKPYEYNSDKFPEKIEKTVQAEKRLDKKIYWDIKMSEIYLMQNNIKRLIENYDQCSLEPDLGVIIGSIGYKNIVDKELFDPLIKQNKCFKETNLNKLILFYCYKDMKDLLKSKDYFNIYFFHRFFGKVFELNFDDLFEEKNNFIFFKVLFNESNTEYWQLGKPFLSKYFFSYNFEGKTISFYDIKENYNEDDSNNVDNSKTILIIVIIGLALIFGILGFFLGRFIYLYRKKRIKNASELLDNENFDGNININEE